MKETEITSKDIEKVDDIIRNLTWAKETITSMKDCQQESKAEPTTGVKLAELSCKRSAINLILASLEFNEGLIASLTATRDKLAAEMDKLTTPENLPQMTEKEWED